MHNKQILKTISFIALVTAITACIIVGLNQKNIFLHFHFHSGDDIYVKTGQDFAPADQETTEATEADKTILSTNKEPNQTSFFKLLSIIAVIMLTKHFYIHLKYRSNKRKKNNSKVKKNSNSNLELELATKQKKE